MITPACWQFQEVYDNYSVGKKTTIWDYFETNTDESVLVNLTVLPSQHFTEDLALTVKNAAQLSCYICM